MRSSEAVLRRLCVTNTLLPTPQFTQPHKRVATHQDYCTPSQDSKLFHHPGFQGGLENTLKAANGSRISFNFNPWNLMTAGIHLADSRYRIVIFDSLVNRKRSEEMSSWNTRAKEQSVSTIMNGRKQSD